MKNTNMAQFARIIEQEVVLKIKIIGEKNGVSTAVFNNIKMEIEFNRGMMAIEIKDYSSPAKMVSELIDHPVPFSFELNCFFFVFNHADDAIELFMALQEL